MIQLRSVSMDYELEGARVAVLSNISLDIESGQTVAIVGPSGSGKTTLLLLLAALETPTQGVIEWQGQDLVTMTSDALADLRRDTMGIIFQSFHLIASLDALSNVALPMELAARRDARSKAEKMLDKVGLAHRSRHYPLQMSGGEQQRVAIARALVHSPDLILADEPTGNLDTQTGQRISDLLFDLHAASGSTLVLVTHDEKLAQRCQRVIRLENGTLVEDETLALSV